MFECLKFKLGFQCEPLVSVMNEFLPLFWEVFPHCLEIIHTQTEDLGMRHLCPYREYSFELHSGVFMVSKVFAPLELFTDLDLQGSLMKGDIHMTKHVSHLNCDVPEVIKGR